MKGEGECEEGEGLDSRERLALNQRTRSVRAERGEEQQRLRQRATGQPPEKKNVTEDRGHQTP